MSTYSYQYQVDHVIIYCQIIIDHQRIDLHKKRYEGIQVFRVAHLLILWVEYRASRQNTLMKGQIQQLQNNNILTSLLNSLLRRHSLGSSRNFSVCVTSPKNVWATLFSQFPRKM